MSTDFRIVSPTVADIPLILSLFRQLAIYEKLEDLFIVDEATLSESLFGAKPSAEVRLAFAGDTAVGYMVFFENFSTFLGRSGIYLEDLFVRPEFRGSGYGKALLSELARIAVERGCKRLEWMVLNSNTPAIDFYKSIRAEPMDGWTTFRLTGEPLHSLAENARR
jgi:ribosomal protein S18 acetylase RimI-like enzyme